MSAFEVNQERGDVGGADSADPAGLAERDGPDALEFFPRLGAKLSDGVVVQARWNRLVLEASEAIDLVELAIDVAVVLGLDRDLTDHIVREGILRQPGVQS